MSENKLIKQLEEVLPEGMTLPKELKMLYEWIESKGFYVDSADYRCGTLYDDEAMRASWTDEHREGGTIIEFSASGQPFMMDWFGENVEGAEEIAQRLCIFAESGGEGSQCALWKADDGSIKVVHLGSGSGSMLTCVLADNFVDFLRLLAIGYDEICWDEEFPYPPNEGVEQEVFVEPNLAFQQWVVETFNTTIPKTALEIVKHPAGMDDEASKDAFFNWYVKFF